jgi:hypothetical protein
MSVPHVNQLIRNNVHRIDAKIVAGDGAMNKSMANQADIYVSLNGGINECFGFTNNTMELSVVEWKNGGKGV